MQSSSPFDLSAAERTVLKSKLLCSFMFFARWFYKCQTGEKFIPAPHLMKIAEALTKVVTGETKNLIINLPPRYGKTELAVKMFVAWVLANNPGAKFIHISYADKLALDNSAEIRALVQSEWFQDLFPTTVRSDSNAKEKWFTTAGGGVYATAAGGQITGFGAGSTSPRRFTGTGSPCDGFSGAIIIDDPLKPDDALSEPRRNHINERFNNTIQSRRNSRDTPVIVIMQRLHEEDMSGYLINGGSSLEWEVLKLPALDENENPLWPFKHTKEELLAIKRASPHVFSSQYQQEPTPLGGDLIKGSWFPRYRALPRMKWRAIYVDTAQKTAERNDYTVFTCAGLGEDGNLYILDVLRGKWEAPALLTNAADFWMKHAQVKGLGKLRKMMIEDKSAGTGLIQQLRTGTTPKPPVVGVQRGKDKLTRLMDVQTYIAVGRVYLPEAGSVAWLSDFIAECELFRADDTHKHDDQVDTLIDAIDDMIGGGVSAADKFRNKAK